VYGLNLCAKSGTDILWNISVHAPGMNPVAPFIFLMHRSSQVPAIRGRDGSPRLRLQQLRVEFKGKTSADGYVLQGLQASRIQMGSQLRYAEKAIEEASGDPAMSN